VLLAYGTHGAVPPMKAQSHNSFRMLNRTAKPVWVAKWHLWTVVIPRRSITGRVVYGRVWRRHDGRHWIYKKFIEYANDE